MLRQPGDLLVVGQHVVHKFSGANEPGVSWILDQCVLGSTGTERVIMAVHLLMHQQPFLT